jgi:hypothetical protein
MRPLKGTSLAETASIDVKYVVLERSGSAVRLPEKSPEKIKNTPPIGYFTHMGSRDPLADHYDLWPTWLSRRHNQFFKFLL